MQAAHTAAPQPRFDYTRPHRTCDVVMKGGVTSGIVYPLAVCELAQSFRFRNIGGTSAGAIAAAVTAAAEYGRDVSGAGFAHLEQLPRWLGAGTNLFSLFQPDDESRGVYETLTAALGGARVDRLFRLFAAALQHFGGWALLGALPGFLLAFVVPQVHGLARVITALAAALLALVGITIAASVGLAVAALRVLPAKGYGLCSGNAPGEGGPPALTPWLADLIDQAAGKNNPAEPLTFGDLWGNDPSGDRRINLEMMTTNLTFGRPYRLPFAEEGFLFHPGEMARIFPRRIVDWMITHAPARAGAHADGLLPLPAPKHLPVVVAARMSLSFPFLISAVPLWNIDRSRNPREPAERCWFSDGGISSNFPIHFFDAALPVRPTFGINLRPFHPDHAEVGDEHDNVWMPDSNLGGIREWWTRFDDAGRAGGLAANARRVGGFVGAILSAMQNWRDNIHLRYPGYRDRVVHISLDERTQGGLNLTMPPEVIARLAERGRCAGEILRARYGGDPLPDTDISWDNHRWVRFRSTMSALSTLLGSMARDATSPAHGEPSYFELIDRGRDEPPSSYRMGAKQSRAAHAALQELSDLCARWADQGVDLSDGAPKPRPTLRITPDY